MILALLYTLSLFWGVGYFFMLNIADNYHCAKVSSPINYLQLDGKFYDGAYRPEKIQDALEHVF